MHDPNAIQDDIIASFSLFEEWLDRYQYLIDLGRKLPALPDAWKTDVTKVRGCMSQVWVHPYPDKDDPRLYHYHGDCDTAVIKGVLALLIQLIDGKTIAQIQQLDVDELFERLNLNEHLSPNRHVGIYAIVELMKSQLRQPEKIPGSLHVA